MEPSLVSCVLGRHKPSTWNDMSPTKEVELVPLSECSSEYNTVIQSIDTTFRNKISSMVRVQNPFLWGSYMLKREECLNRGADVTEKKLFHATGELNVLSICQNNLDWRRSTRTKFGQGVSFSPSEDYANMYCNQLAGNMRALIIATVLVGRETQGNCGTIIPPRPYDTTIGRYGQVVVKYNDNEFYPLYVAYYSR